MGEDNGNAQIRLNTNIHPCVKVELTRLKLQLGLSSSGDVLMELLDRWHDGPRGNPAIWEALKADSTISKSSPGGD